MYVHRVFAVQYNTHACTWLRIHFHLLTYTCLDEYKYFFINARYGYAMTDYTTYISFAKEAFFALVRCHFFFFFGSCLDRCICIFFFHILLYFVFGRSSIHSDNIFPFFSFFFVFLKDMSILCLNWLRIVMYGDWWMLYAVDCRAYVYISIS